MGNARGRVVVLALQSDANAAGNDLEDGVVPYGEGSPAVMNRARRFCITPDWI